MESFHSSEVNQPNAETYVHSLGWLKIEKQT